MIYGGTKGTVICLDEKSGRELWRQPLDPGVFGASSDVALLLRGELLIASCQGNVWGLDAASGRILWHNELPGMGYGFVSLCDDTHSVQYIHRVDTQTTHSTH